MKEKQEKQEEIPHYDRPSILTDELQAFLEDYVKHPNVFDIDDDGYCGHVPVIFEVYEESGFKWLVVDASYSDGEWNFTVGYSTYEDVLDITLSELNRINALLTFPMQVKIWNTGKICDAFFKEWAEEERLEEEKQKEEEKRKTEEKRQAEEKRKAEAAEKAKKALQEKLKKSFSVPAGAICFKLRNYYDVIDELAKKPTYENAQNQDLCFRFEDANLSLSANRIVVPELDLSFRKGVAYEVGGDMEDIYDVLAIYTADELSPWKPEGLTCQYSIINYLRYSYDTSLDVGELLCYINQNEYLMPEEIQKEYDLEEDEIRVELPNLVFNSRKTTKYDDHLGEMVYAYLFKKKSYAAIEREILGLDSTKTKGWEAKRALGSLGLTNNHKGIFMYMQLRTGLASLAAAGSGYERILELLKELDK